MGVHHSMLEEEPHSRTLALRVSEMRHDFIPQTATTLQPWQSRVAISHPKSHGKGYILLSLETDALIQ